MVDGSSSMVISQRLGRTFQQSARQEMLSKRQPAIAVLIPCHDEALNIKKVVEDFRRVLPTAEIFVYDNNSRDDTLAIARNTGARVRSESLQGKGNVVRRMFADIEADIYLLVDGDDTYDAASAPRLLDKLITEHLDMVSACRQPGSAEAFRSGHRFGNRLLSGIVRAIFGDRIKDMLSGYRAFSRRFVKSFPILSTGFEIETELTVHALELGMPVGEITTPYGARAKGSKSKLRTYRDGLRILMTIGMLIKEERPLHFFLLLAASCFLASVALGIPIVTEFMATGLVPRFPTAILATGLMLMSFVSVGVGLILDTVTRGRKEVKKLAYLQIPLRWR
jgi:glycosyltransferase involved in cell wall biosynthesis